MTVARDIAADRPNAFQGEPGAFGEDALIAAFGESGERVAHASFGDVFTAVADGSVAAGVVPIENSLHGSVLEVCDLLLARDVVVLGEVTVPVRHCLLGRPGAELADITVAHSHPQALAQSRDFLEEHGIDARAATNTARAARELAQGGDPAHAAIA
ncbi:MAG: prephenate dehydratase, partial [Thermoleophilia bacterium]|nr:prephenate dehydratase [Thermoleophilia bacterium]